MMMRWDPILGADETVLVSCSVRPRLGKRFEVLLTDRRLLHLRKRRAGAIETVEAALPSMQQVILRKLPPWSAWAIGAVAAGVGIGWAIAFSLRLVRTIAIEAAAFIGLAGVVILRAARPQWGLEWTIGGQRYRLSQQFSWESGIEAEMSAALQEIGRLLADPSARAARLTQFRAERAGETTIDEGERWLCSDGGCTGLIGDDGRCRVCGRSG